MGRSQKPEIRVGPGWRLVEEAKTACLAADGQKTRADEGLIFIRLHRSQQECSREIFVKKISYLEASERHFQTYSWCIVSISMFYF